MKKYYPADSLKSPKFCGVRTFMRLPEHTVPGFRTGGHMTEKDRPRKKDWKREYYKNKEPGRYRDDTGSGSFVIYC